MRLSALISALAVALAGACTVTKPVVCAFSYPIDEMGRSLSKPLDKEEEYAWIPPPLVLIASPVLIPLRFMSLSVMGIAGGLVSGLASDLNVITWNCERPWTNLSRPFRTNARKPMPAG